MIKSIALTAMVRDDTVRLALRTPDAFVPVEFRLTLPTALDHWHTGLGASAATLSLTIYSAPATS